MPESRCLDPESLLDAHGSFVTRTARALLRDEDLADDAVQETWLASLATRAPQSSEGWLRTVVGRLAGRTRRDAARRRLRERRAARAEETASTLALVEQRDLIRRLADAVMELPEPMRQAVILRFYAGLPPRRIAERMAVPVATVRSRIRLGLQRIRLCLVGRPSRASRSWSALVGLAAWRPDPRPVTALLGACAMKTVVKIGVVIGVAALVAVLATDQDDANPERRADALVDDGTVPEWAGAARAVSDPIPSQRFAEQPADRDQPEAAPRLRGTVVDLRGNPIPNASIHAGARSRNLTRIAAADSSGCFDFVPGDGIARIQALADGWAPSPIMTVEESVSTEITLRLPGPAATVRGIVVDASGTGVAAATVFAGREQELPHLLPDGTEGEECSGVSTRTAKDGTFELTSVPPGWFVIRVRADRHAPHQGFHTVFAGNETTLRIELRAGIWVEGRVRDEQARPVADATVLAGRDAGTTTDADGRYRIGPLAEGKRVRVRGPLGGHAELRVRGEPGWTVTWDPILAPGRALVGTVVDAGGRPLTSFWVTANRDTWPGWQSATTTDERGRFLIAHVPEQPVRVEVRRAGEPTGVPLLVEERVVADGIDLRLTVRTDARDLATARGMVLDADGRRPRTELRWRHVTRGQSIQLTGGSGAPVRLDAAGRFTVRDVPPGEWELVAVGELLRWWRLATVNLAPGEVRTLDPIRIPRAGFLRTTAAADERDGPPAAIRYLLERPSDFVRIMEWTGSMPERLSLAPGHYALEVEVLGGPVRRYGFDISSGADTMLEIRRTLSCEHRLVFSAAGGFRTGDEVMVRVIDTASSRTAVTKTVVAGDARPLNCRVMLAPGRYRIEARDTRGRTASTDAELFGSKPGRDVKVTLK